jgi:DNA-directed RNA polymerase subunit RPC12/RpoP
MSEGYLLEELGDTFCSDTCLDKVFPGSSIEMKNMTEEELEQSNWYWTSWEEDSEEVKAQYKAMGLEVADDNEVKNSSEITCPYCGHENHSEKSDLQFENEIDCEGCNKRFAYTMSITYSSFGVEQIETI